MWPEGPRESMKKYRQVLSMWFLFVWLENLQHFLNLRGNFRCNAIWHCKYAILFSLMWCDVHNPWPLLSSVGGVRKTDITVMPPVTCMDWLRWQYNHTADVLPPLIALAFVTKMTETCKSTVPIAIQVKKWWNTINIEETLDVISRLEIA